MSIPPSFLFVYPSPDGFDPIRRIAFPESPGCLKNNRMTSHTAIKERRYIPPDFQVEPFGAAAFAYMKRHLRHTASSCESMVAADADHAYF